ncbi:MAG: hypothetical protein ACFFB5_07065 [Promethearchaeota archaeon]
MVYCKECNFHNEADAIFCVSCGVQLNELREYKVSSPNKQKSHSKTYIVAAAAAAAAATAIIIF